MRRRRRTDRVVDVIVVRTDDGKTFRCSIAFTGREAQPRWALIDERADQYLGPPVTPDRSPEGVRRQILDWWASRRGAARPPDRAPAGDQRSSPGE